MILLVSYINKLYKFILLHNYLILLNCCCFFFFNFYKKNRMFYRLRNGFFELYVFRRFFFFFVCLSFFTSFDLLITSKKSFSFDSGFLVFVFLNAFFSICFCLRALVGFIAMIMCADVNNYLGIKYNIDITGYSRRAWFNNCLSRLIYFKLGKSHLNKKLIPLGIRLRLIKRRFLKFFSVDSDLLDRYCISIFNLRRADPYKGGGMLYNKYPLKYKERSLKK